MNGDELLIIYYMTSHGDEWGTVDDIYITSPNDVKIHNETNALTITLVTCYPFSYFGPAPDRYVVVASQSK